MKIGGGAGGVQQEPIEIESLIDSVFLQSDHITTDLCLSGAHLLVGFAYFCLPFLP